MSATFRAEGNRIDHTPVAAVTAGDVVVQNGWVCVATRDIAAGALGSLACEGILDFDKEEVAFAVGEDVYYDEDTGRIAPLKALQFSWLSYDSEHSRVWITATSSYRVGDTEKQLQVSRKVFVRNAE